MRPPSPTDTAPRVEGDDRRAIERIVRPIVEGQIRGFLKEHPALVDAVDWYKPRKDDKTKTFVDSLAKRIVRDLACRTTTARLKAALLALGPDAHAASANGTYSVCGGDAVALPGDGIPERQGVAP